MSIVPPTSRGSDRIFLEDVRFFGHHGGPQGAEADGAWFSVDVELSLDLSAASLSDDLGATVDYGRVARRVVEIGTRERVRLLERLAGLVAEALIREFPARQVRLRVRKLTPPVEGIHGTPGVEITRTR